VVCQNRSLRLILFAGLGAISLIMIIILPTLFINDEKGQRWSAMLIYLHGLNGSDQCREGGVLRERLVPSRVLVPAYPAHRPDSAIANLSDLFRGLRGKQPLVVVGSSMGGFYAQYLARQFTFAHLFLINPALTPWDLLQDFETLQTTDYGETYRIDRDMIESTRKYGVANPCDGVQTTLFLDQGDEVIDFRIAESLYRDCGRLLIFEGGDHAFQLPGGSSRYYQGGGCEEPVPHFGLFSSHLSRST